MMSIVPKWKVEVWRGQSPLEFDVSDYHLGNVLTLLAKMDFGAVHRIAIEAVPVQPTQTGVSSHVTSPYDPGQFVTTG